MPDHQPEQLIRIKQALASRALILNTEHTMVSPSGLPQKWTFDIRSISLDADFLKDFSEVFWQIYENSYPFQIGGQETAAIPFIAAVALRGKQIGKPINAFYIRKSRKNIGLQKIIEGEISDQKVILLDDIVNSGQTLLRQLAVLEENKIKISDVFCFIKYKSDSNYQWMKEKGILLTALFELKDFGITLEEIPISSPGFFSCEWEFRASNPNYFYVVPKSAPALDEEKLYFGCDNGYFVALDQKSGNIQWEYKTKPGAAGKSIFSSPAAWNGLVYFGAYDGNVYCLETSSGKCVWKFSEADWVGSSPVIAKNLGLLFIGLEFGLWKKRGGITALDLKTGSKKWEYSLSQFVHSSPAYSEEKKLVAIGSNNNSAYLFKAQSGALLWQFKTGGEIKASLVFDIKNNALVFGSFDGKIYSVDIETGVARFFYETNASIFSTPAISGDSLVFTSLDKIIYCLSAKTGELIWKFQTRGRIFASPVIWENFIYCGSNDGAMYQLDLKNGQLCNIFQATERITNKIACNPLTKTIFVPTYANQIYCLKAQEN